MYELWYILFHTPLLPFLVIASLYLAFKSLSKRWRTADVRAQWRNELAHLRTEIENSPSASRIESDVSQ